MKLKVPNKAHRSNKVSKTEKHSGRVAYQAALEGIVLLENDGALPLAPGKLALYGAGAGMTIKGGSGSGEVNERHACTILEGLEQAGFQITTKKWISDYEKEYQRGLEKYRRDFQKTHSMRDMVNLMADPYLYPYGRRITKKDIEASETRTCIYVLARQAGEGADRKLYKNEYTISREERENIRICAAHYEKFILVINTGSSFDMKFTEVIKGINGVVYYCQQGSQGGRAFADLILGKQNFSGKLTDTWAHDYYDIPYAGKFSYLNGNLKEEYYQEGIYVGYRYFDTFQVEPKYPFGYGLSYTDFQIRPLQVSARGSAVTVCAAVKNTGDTYSGKEILQLYVSCPQADLEKEYQKLAAFAKTELLMPGQEQELELKFDLKDLASFDEKKGEGFLSAGDYLLRLGNCSRNTVICGAVTLDRYTVTGRYEKVCTSPLRVEEIAAPKVVYEEIPGAEKAGLCAEDQKPMEGQEPAESRGSVGASDFGFRHLYISGDEIKTVVYRYDPPAPASSRKADALLDRMPVKDQVKLLTGPGYFGGRKWMEVPGAAGYTTGELIKYGIPNVALADGPAGLRLQRVSAVTKSGSVKMVDTQIDVLNYVKLPLPVRKMMFGDPQKDTLVYQYTTSFPVGQALAQTWNTELVKEVGRAVSAEMTKYGVSYWLAPALNIHRSPLCGRNFEYYSEDPCVAGRMAAAMCQGVQETPGNYVTVKHFCCNNQEDNRNHVNVNVNERPLREIYLKAFEIAVKEGKPGAVMSSYNKVNGEYVNNSYALLTQVLRNEWGYQNLVMTDWFATGKEVGSHVLAVKSGNDLIEPGGRDVYQELMKGLREGTLTEEEVRWCAANVLKGILSTRVYQEMNSI